MYPMIDTPGPLSNSVGFFFDNYVDLSNFVYWRGGSEVLFFTLPTGPKLFPHVGITVGITQASLHIFLTLDAFSTIFPMKKPRNNSRT